MPPVSMEDIQKDFENKPGSLSSMYEKGDCQTFCMVGRGLCSKENGGQNWQTSSYFPYSMNHTWAICIVD